MSPGTLAPLVATYRLQLHAQFTFNDAAAVVPYLASLGISHLYLSPVLQAASGSTHGYDQCDPRRLSEELGGEAAFGVLSATASAHGMGILLDIVPNHMAASDQNPLWWELLRTGRQGAVGAYFDIDWESPDDALRDRVLLPFLGGSADKAIAAGDLHLEPGPAGKELRYFDARYPLREGTENASMRDVLAEQHYVLADWRDATDRLNYRRFFDINTLVAVREEEPAVFDALHGKVLELVRGGMVQGLRVDHVDGLADPAGYLRRLRAEAGERSWILVEKILEPGERLPDWPVDGTTGYDFIHRLSAVFVEPGARERMTRIYSEFTTEVDYDAVVAAAKKQVAEQLFSSDIARLARILARQCAAAGVTADEAAAAAAIAAVGCWLTVYRTYAAPGGGVDDAGRERLEHAFAEASGRREADPKVLEVLRRSLLSPTAGTLALMFQQLTGPLMAKGVEDTAFYRYQRLICLNEVGGDPGTFGLPVEQFHAANAQIARDHPRTMLASSTHDTKRSEDVRARLSLLPQCAGDWAAAVRRWSAANGGHRGDGGIDGETEYLIYQTLVGAWPLELERAQAFIAKAIREAKRHTSWIEPNARYEAAVHSFVDALYGSGEFQADLEGFVRPLVAPGRQVSLAQTLLKLTAPGVPDIYQGTELWDLSLVDPDNRRPVDYALRQAILAAPGSKGGDDGAVKLRLVREALALRRRRPDAFGTASAYTPLQASGPAAANVIAFARGTRDDPLQVAVGVPRLVLDHAVDWGTTRLELGPGRWRQAIADDSGLLLLERIDAA
ncbi:MAG: malto-oligosyltrehalose synthase [Candidatus Dormibacteria bacterium]